MNDDYISRRTAVNAVHNVPKGNWSNARYAHELQAVPTADVAPVVHGRWVVTYFPDYIYARCDQCRTIQIFYHNKPLTTYCPNCGARMDRKKGNCEAQKRDLERDLENARRSMEEAIATPLVDVTRWQYPQLTKEAKQDAVD